MNEKISMLPVGSIVYLNDGNVKMVVLAIGQLVPNEDNELPTYWDYMGGVYPQGLQVDHMYYFNQKDIAKIVFRGYEDDDSERYIELIKDWKEKHASEYKIDNELKTQVIDEQN